MGSSSHGGMHTLHEENDMVNVLQGAGACDAGEEASSCRYRREESNGGHIDLNRPYRSQ